MAARTAMIATESRIRGKPLFFFGASVGAAPTLSPLGADPTLSALAGAAPKVCCCGGCGASAEGFCSDTCVPFRGCHLAGPWSPCEGQIGAACRIRPSSGARSTRRTP
jgi:hypothetical protein